MVSKRRAGARVAALVVALAVTLMGPAGMASADIGPGAVPLGGAVSAVSLGGAVPLGGAAPIGTPAPARGGVGAVSAKDTVVTLITGDRVTVSGDGPRLSVERGKGRAGISFTSLRVGGHVQVVPSDARALLAAGRLDGRLFDVTLLRELGYDGRRQELPLIVTAAATPAAPKRGAQARAALRSSITGLGAQVTQDLPAIGGLAVRADTGRVAGLWRALTGAAPASAGLSGGASLSARASMSARASLSGGASKVWLDGVRKPALDVSVPQLGAPTAWKAGFDGRGVRVAVLDTGIDAGHQDLAGKVVAEKNFTNGSEDDKDHVGHGTHVASTIVGSGAVSGGKYQGVAPGARVLDGKVCSARRGCPESSVLAGMQWAVDQKASVVSMSLGGPDTPGIDPVEEAVNTLTAASGTLFVIASGNDGAEGTTSSPGTADAALSVGAVDKSDQLAPFSSRGPRADGGLKPDVTAPGVDVTAALSRDADLKPALPGYTTMSGTSMATPHVAGAAAILKQRRPAWTAGQLKAALMGSAAPNPKLGAYAQGAGRVDVARAIDQVVSAEPASVSFGRQSWPHTDDVPVTRGVTYRNAGGAEVTLALAMQAQGSDGKPSPEGMFTLSASTVKVPAGGTASVKITANTRGTAAVWPHTGRVVATAAGGTVVQAPFAVDVEKESYDLTLVHRDRKGSAASSYFTQVVTLDGPTEVYELTSDNSTSTKTLRLPKGRYAVHTDIMGSNGDQSLLAQPVVDLRAKTTVNLDARIGKPVKITAPDPSATSQLSVIETGSTGTDFSIGISYLDSTFDHAFLGQVGPSTKVNTFRCVIFSFQAKPGSDGTEYNSPSAYNFTYNVDGYLPAGFTKRVAKADLAAVRASFSRQGPAEGVVRAFSELAGHSQGTWYSAIPFSLPSTRTDYFNTDSGVKWYRIFAEVTSSTPDTPSEDISAQRSAPVSYVKGRTSTEQWNRAPFAPTLSDPLDETDFITRYQDTLFIAPPLYGDSAGHTGYGNNATGHLTVTRDGTTIVDTAAPGVSVRVPTEQARYTVTADTTRGAPSVLSTKVTAKWTFRSGHVDGETVQRLPVPVIRFSPTLTATNTAKAGATLAIPVTVQRQPGSAKVPTASLKVQVSYDDGATWSSADVKAAMGTTTATVKHPNRAGFVSLRGTVTDTAGNLCEVTIIRAYQITA